ncbi:uncharacterized protein C8A04DRAFT_39647 [Dichotomopilus funicola]|uniref:Uncharacterized protein n=1 Tax=Dichotomopilus funicola TaxID=1934379 RepID=A0AAN6UWY4_9PEZI|nr:hypothetical protein C8A04DRAFT_39647 [Dichotomopilus funicola]
MLKNSQIAEDAVATQARNLPLLATRELCAGKTYIVTGANVGLGFEAAKHLASLGAGKVVLAVRTPAKGEAAKAAIDEAAGTGAAGVVEVWPLDLERYESVKAFARRAEAELDRIDAVVENAAVALATRQLAEGHVKPLTVNVLSTFLLAVLLVPVMREKARRAGDGVLPRLVVVTSRAGFEDKCKADWEGIKADPIKGMDAEDMVPVKTYPLSKVTETFALRHLAREVVPVEKGGVILNLVCPGLCITELGRNAPPEFAARLRAMHASYGRTAEDGSRTLLHGAVAGVESHGTLLHSCADGEPDVPDWVKNETEVQKNTWEFIAKELEAIEPGCVSKLL